MSEEKKDLNFGQSLAELEAIVARLEGGQLELEDSIREYERGVGLIRVLSETLAVAEQKVTNLLGQIAPADDDA
ncbi:MAG: exodeoxyribonuclease VII small subunit [Actinomycetes bacterium]|jgi:exodeoxyribonuclease VII small subunit|nr:exodeoxyribonuclease VII small subunit [Actinomycetes bacterium]